MEDVQRRKVALEETLTRSNFPLSGPILGSLAELTGTELVVFDASRTFQVASRSFTGPDQAELEVGLDRFSQDGSEIDLEAASFLGFDFVRAGQTGERDFVVVLFARDDVERMSRAASFLPLVTGLSTVVLLTAVVLLLAGRMIARLSDVQGRVNQIAEGDFATLCPEEPSDEVGRLGVAINKMTGQLQSLWNSTQRDQAAKLLHQMASGMAHQLRNTLTGSRLAIELHSRELSEPTEEIDVALQQIRSAEEYVSRILLVGKGEIGEAKAGRVDNCLGQLRSNLEAFASHLAIDLSWEIDETVKDDAVADGSSLNAAVSNLVLNALQAASTRVTVRCAIESRSTAENVNDDSGESPSGSFSLNIEVIDDGPGVNRTIQDTLFEPFVTTKPEGCGLGLATVKKSIEQIGGTIRYERVEAQTKFHLHCPCVRRA
ncbi:MAG: HAMP domain-containing sensor histidine kinase [Planctomycetota bacterium]